MFLWVIWQPPHPNNTSGAALVVRRTEVDPRVIEEANMALTDTALVGSEFLIDFVGN